MIQFKASNIILLNEEIANELKNARLEKSINLNTVSKDLKISIKYLNALEKGDFNELPKGVYGKNFLKEYALYLKLDYKKILNKYSELENDYNKLTNPFAKKIVKKSRLVIFPKIFKNIVIIGIVVLCLAYFALSIKKIIFPPFLELINPKEDMIISGSYIDIVGKTEPESQVIINGEALEIDQIGNFNKRLDLSIGENLITISAKKKYSREVKITRQIIVK